jgi:hypothetical protein
MKGKKSLGTHQWSILGLKVAGILIGCLKEIRYRQEISISSYQPGAASTAEVGDGGAHYFLQHPLKILLTSALKGNQ